MNVIRQSETSNSLPKIELGVQSLCSQPIDDKTQTNKARRRRSGSQTVVEMGNISENLADFERSRENIGPAPMRSSPVLFKTAATRRNSVATTFDKLPVMLTNNNLRLRKYSCPEMPMNVLGEQIGSNLQNSQESKQKVSSDLQSRTRSRSFEKPAEIVKSKPALEKSINKNGEPINTKQAIEKRRRSSTGTQPKMHGAPTFPVAIDSPKTTHMKNSKQLEEKMKQITVNRISDSKTNLKTTESLPKLNGDSKDDFRWSASIKGCKDSPTGTIREESTLDFASTSRSLYSDSASLTTFHEEIVSLFSYSSNVRKMDGLATPKPMANRGRSSIISWIKEVNSTE